MKTKDQMAMSDGFDRNVAEKMPKIRRQDEFTSFDREAEVQGFKEEPLEKAPPEKEPKKRVLFSSPKPGPEREKRPDVLNLIDDLHAQLLISNQTKRALETDLVSSQKALQQLVQDNHELRSQLEDVQKEFQRLNRVQAETAYLKEENGDALERIRIFQQELKNANEALARVTQERDEALNQALELKSQAEQIEAIRIKAKLREREASHFAEENRELRASLEEIQLQNMELEREYEEMRRSFNEVRESLTLLRDSCKAHYYNLSESPA